MAKRRLNKKVALIGSAVLVFVVVGLIWVMLGLSKDPSKSIEEAEAAVLEKDYETAITRYMEALGRSKTNEFREEVLLRLVDVSIEADMWESVIKYWTNVIAINPLCAKARFGRLKYLYIVAESGSSRVWQQVRTDATEFLEMAEEEGLLSENVAQWDVLVVQGEEPVDQALGVYLRLARARATLESAMLDALPNKEDALIEVVEDLNDVKLHEPKNIEVYRYLAGTAVERGKILVARGDFAAKDRAALEAKGLLEEAVKIAPENPSSHTNLIRLKLAFAQREKQPKEEIKALEVEFNALSAKFPTSAEVYTVVSEYYSTLSSYSLAGISLANLDKAIEAAEKASELDPKNVAYVINAIRFHDRKFSIHKVATSLHRARELVKQGLALRNAKDRSGPWSFLAKVNRFRLYSFLAQISIKEILEPSESRDASETQKWLADAEKAVHEIAQVFDSGQEPQVVKWRGMLELAKGQRKSAIKKLHAAYEQIRSLKPSNPPWPRDAQFADLCRLLARIYRDTSEVGAVAEFLTNSLHSGISTISPEVRLDYVEAILKFGLWVDAVEHLDVFERRLAPNSRSIMLRIRAHIGAGEFDKAATALAARPENDPNAIKSSLVLLDARIRQTQLSIARVENKEFLDVAFEGLVIDVKDQDSASNLAAMRKELDDYKDVKVQLVKKLLETAPESIGGRAVIDACKHLVRKGSLDKAKKLISQFLGHSPEYTNALIYTKMLSEPKPNSVPMERLREIEEQVLSNIPDAENRALQLGIFYRRQREYDKAIAVLQKGFQAGPREKTPQTWYFDIAEQNSRRFLIAGHLFDIAVDTEKWDIAAQVVVAARDEDMDRCDGNIFAARLAFAKRDFKEAKTRVDEALKQRPAFSRAYSLRSNINAALGDEHAAIEDVRRATSLNPLDGLIAKGYAQLLYIRNEKLGDSVTVGQTTETRKALQRAMALSQGDKDLRRFYANFIATTEPLKALAILQAFHKSDPSFENSLQVGELATRIARDETNEQKKAVLFSVAGAALDNAREAQPTNQAMLYRYTEYLRAMGRDKEVEDMLGQTNEKGLLWNHYYQRAQYAEAKTILEEMYAADSKDIQVIKGLVLIAEKTSDPNASAKYTTELIAVDPSVDNYLIQIQSFLRVGLVSEAAMKLQSFNEKNPDEQRTLLLRAWLEMRKGQLGKGLELTNRFLENNPDSSTGWRLRGEIRFYEGDITKAISDLKRSKSLDERPDPATRVVLAKAYLRVSRFEDAVTELKNAIDSPGVPMEARLLLEETYKQLERKESLGQFYAATISDFPTSVFWLNRAGAFALTEADYTRASALYARGFQLKRDEHSGDPTGELRFDGLYASAFDGYLRSFIMLAGLPKGADWNPKKLDEVFELAKEYLGTAYSPLAYLRMAQAKLLLGHKKTAVEYCQKAVDEADSNQALAAEILLRMFLLLGPEEVAKYCAVKLAKDPNSIPANFTMFNLHKVNRQYLKALPYIEKCIQLVDEQNSKKLDYTAKKAEILTLAYQRSSDNKYLQMAIVDYKSLLAKMPNNTSVLNNLAYMIAESGKDFPEALKYAEKVYNLTPNDPGVLDTYGYVLYRNGKYSEALGHLNAALQHYGQKKLYVGSEVYEHLGQIKEALADKLGALAAYERALEIGAGSLSNEDINRMKEAIRRLSQ